MQLNCRPRAGAALGLLCLLALAGCAPDVEPALRVGTNIWPGYEPLYLARELGYYSDAEVRLVEYSSATEVIHAWRNAAIDAAALTLDEVLRLAQDGHEPRVVAVLDVSNGADVLLARRSIASLTALRGRRIGVENTAVGGYLLARALAAAGLSRRAVEAVPLEIHRHEQAFVRGEVDAVVTFDPVRARLLARGAHTLFDSRRIPGEIVDVLAVRPDLLDRDPGRARVLVDGWRRAVDQLRRDPHSAAQRMAPRLAVSPAELLASLDGLHIPDLAENRRLLAGPDAALLRPARQLAHLMLEQRLLHSPVAVEPLIDARLLAEATP